MPYYQQSMYKNTQILKSNTSQPLFSSSSSEQEVMENRLRFLPTTLNGHWQSEADMPHRRRMIAEIAAVLKLQDKNTSASPEWLRKLPQMVKQLEVSLYRSAPSLEAYCDTATLKYRLQDLAMQISANSYHHQQQEETKRQQQMMQMQEREPDQQSDRSEMP